MLIFCIHTRILAIFHLQKKLMQQIFHLTRVDFFKKWESFAHSTAVVHILQLSYECFSLFTTNSYEFMLVVCLRCKCVIEKSKTWNANKNWLLWDPGTFFVHHQALITPQVSQNHFNKLTKSQFCIFSMWICDFYSIRGV